MRISDWSSDVCSSDLLALRAGYFCVDTFTPLTRNAYTAARAAADCALTAAELLLQGERLAYALCRPPGHHAERSVFGGFCYLNNAAIAAQNLALGGRKVALLRSEEHTSELQSLMGFSVPVLLLKK